MKLIPLASDSKEPLSGESWKRLVSDDPCLHQKWIAEGKNVGCPLAENGLSVVDFDTGLDPAREFFSKHKELCRVIVLTRRGVHFYFSGNTKTRKFEHGDIKGNGYCVFPPSTVNGFQYRFAEGHEWNEPAPFPEELFPSIQGETRITREKVQNVMAYLAKVESIQGQYSIKGVHRSAGLIRAASICRDAGLTESDAMLKMLWWNTQPVVSPPWPAEEIARAVHSSYKKVM